MSSLDFSNYLNQYQLKGLLKLGDEMIPGGGDYPSFSQTNCILRIDQILEPMDSSDVSGLKIVFFALGFLPKKLIELFGRLLLKADSLPWILGDAVRLLNVGLKGIVMSLYYSDPKVHQLMGFRVSVKT